MSDAKAIVIILVLAAVTVGPLLWGAARMYRKDNP
jgi:hypothetical protein